ncbi:DUF4198 domain-containing protein [Desulfobulbus rhabdoformis]|uniref:DUF4198 domain-containing protein n=1 Tax=Desulfobulbus rhabdoformis TaxID=34032 RepID=UPI001966A6FD|nr:DUF4198 domain-containing protein [Desulfobulbus rhabdoformis]MBM9616730.1 DUF4198 domain-containing protein [Desulfobulbus rhabdoformis]
MRKPIVLMSFLLLLFASQASAHSFWINSFESHGHGAHNTMVSLGWGHALPMDDVLNSVNARIEVESFDLFTPSLQKTALRKTPVEVNAPSQSTADFDLFDADLATQKIALKKEAEKGVYQFAAVSKPTFYVQYIDKKGNKRLKMKPMDQIQDIDKVLMAVKYQAFAKSYLTVGAWQQPKPLGHGMEIIPRTDLSDVHVGDLVEVDVIFYGEPLQSTAKSSEHIKAVSNSFGQSDGFYLASTVKNGKACFRVQSAGQWQVSVSHKDDVTPDGEMKDLMGKAQQVYHGASLTFNVK